MPPNELSQSLAMSLPFASAIALARMCIASTAAHTVVDEVHEVLDLFASECPSRRGTMCMGNASLTNDEIPFGLLGALRRLDELTPRCIHREDIAATVNPFAPAGSFPPALMVCTFEEATDNRQIHYLDSSANSCPLQHVIDLQWCGIPGHGLQCPVLLSGRQMSRHCGRRC